MTSLKLLKIVVASPGDVQAERDILEEVAADLNRGIAAARGIHIEIKRWETDTYPGFYPEGPQGLIDSLLHIEDCDVLIGIFWKRFGTPTKDAQSGTEHELRIAYRAWQEKNTPQIMTYFNQSPYTVQTSEEAEQLKRVLAFREDFPVEGLWWPYSGTHEFERLVRRHLTLYIRNRISLSGSPPIGAETRVHDSANPSDSVELPADKIENIARAATSLDIVRKYRLIYERTFMTQTLRMMVPNAQRMIPAFLDNELGFPGYHIIFVYGGPTDSAIWTSTMVVRPKGEALTGIILANPNLLKESKEVRKRILAKAWIEVMMGFHNEKGPENHVSGKLSLPGDDSLDEIVNMELAMHELLVPDKALDEMAQEFGLSSLRAVKDLIISDPQKAIATIDHIAYAVSGKRSANRELVRERIREILFIEV